MELLLLLVEQRGQLVTRERIIERVWGKDVFLDTDNSINAAIRKIRQTLQDDPDQPRFVQTVIGRGYRFIASVEEASVPPIPFAVGEQVFEGPIGKRVSHYRILQLLGGGGMGLVYMAEDLRLGRRVAVKFLPQELADDPIALDRLQAEARAASALDHPNICSIYELGEYGGQPFIVMQFLEGQTLREWIQSAVDVGDPRRLNQVLDLAGQIADGLAAAHRGGTIHRDIKPTNIFVTSQGLVKILDFGVAQLVASRDEDGAARSDESGASNAVAASHNVCLSDSELSCGTPSYLSPEQIRREPLDARADLFSFGLVLCEMATGHQAFSGNTPQMIRDAILRLPAIPPRQLNPSLPRGLERIINKCLEKDLSARYQSATDLQRDLAQVKAGPTLMFRRSVTRRMWLASCVLLLVGILGLNTGRIRQRVFRRAPSVAAATTSRVRASIAVLGFKNLSAKDEEGWISVALSEMLGAELASGQQLHLIAGENVARMKVDLALPRSDSYGAATLAKVRKYLNTDMVVVGSYLALGESTGGKIRVNLQLQDANAGETIAVISEDGAEADLAELVSRSGDRIRQVLRIGGVAVEDADQVRTALPGNTEAMRFYAEGLAQFRRFDALAARDFFLKAIAADPSHALSHAALSECWSALGYDLKAQEEAKKAVRLSSKLSREDQLSVEGRYRQVAHEWQRASEIYRMLWVFFPDNLDFGLQLARVQSSAGLGKEAMAAVDELSKRPLPPGGDPRIDIAEAVAADKLGDLRREEAAATRAAEKGRRQGARILTADALLIRGATLGALGDSQNAVVALQEAQEIFASVGEKQGVARVLNNLGIIERHRSNLAEAQRLLEESVKISRQTGSKVGLQGALTNLGNVLWDRGDVARTMEVYRQSLKLSREIGDKFHESSSLGNIAGLLTLQGKLARARQMYDEALRLSNDLGDQEGIGLVLGNIADLLTRQGKLAEARKLAEQAVLTDRKVGAKSIEGYALHQLASVLALQGDLAASRNKFQDAIALRRELGERETEAESQLGLAQLQLDAGDAREAELNAQHTAIPFHDESSVDGEVLSYSLLALASLELGKLPEAQRAVEKSNELLGKALDLTTRLQAELTSAYVTGVLNAVPNLVARGTASAARELEAVREKSTRLGYVGLDLEARLRLAELEIQTGKAKAGRTRLDQLQQDAQAKGFLLIARQASEALRADAPRL